VIAPRKKDCSGSSLASIAATAVPLASQEALEVDRFRLPLGAGAQLLSRAFSAADKQNKAIFLGFMSA